MNKKIIGAGLAVVLIMGVIVKGEVEEQVEGIVFKQALNLIDFEHEGKKINLGEFADTLQNHQEQEEVIESFSKIDNDSLEDKIKDINEKIEDGDFINLANSNDLSKSERDEFNKLLILRNALYIEKTNRVLEGMM